MGVKLLWPPIGLRLKKFLDDEFARGFRSSNLAGRLGHSHARKLVWRHRLIKRLAIKLPITVQEVAPFIQEGLISKPEWAVQISEVGFPNRIENLKGVFHKL